MDKQLFWDIIDRARKKSDGVIIDNNLDDGWHGMGKELLKELSMFGDADILEWQDILDFYKGLLYKNELWVVADVLNGWCSDDGFDYFCNWLIAQGEDVVKRALHDPESLVDLEICQRGNMRFETFSYAPLEAYENLYGIINEE